MFTEAELSLICIHIGKLHTEKVIERIEVPTDLVPFFLLLYTSLVASESVGILVFMVVLHWYMRFQIGKFIN